MKAHPAMTSVSLCFIFSNSHQIKVLDRSYLNKILKLKWLFAYVLQILFLYFIGGHSDDLMPSIERDEP